MNLREVVSFIITDASVKNDGMSAIITAIKERQKINRAGEKALAQATLRVGMAVRLGGLTPKYWNGTEGVITGFNKTRTRANIRITKSSDFRIKEGSVRDGFPLTTLTPTEVTAYSSITNEDANALLDFLEA